MASPGDIIFWPKLDGSPSKKKWPAVSIEPVDLSLNTLDNSVGRAAAEIRKAMAEEPERYKSPFKKVAWWRRYMNAVKVKLDR